MGDFNLSHRVKEDQQKIKDLCQESMVNALKEITRSISNNQLDYVLIEKSLEENCFCTSYTNYISDHNTITSRVGLEGNGFTDRFKEKQTFDRDSHLKKKGKEGDLLLQSTSSELSSGSEEDDGSDLFVSNSDNDEAIRMHSFKRRFLNLDWTNCWLNSCLQLILSALDHSNSVHAFTSELGQELLRLQRSEPEFALDAANVKQIIVTAEDTRIATRLSELQEEIADRIQLNARIADVEKLRLNLLHGQQCVRDLFVCLNENVMNWPDVFSHFGFNVTTSFSCDGCGTANSHDILQSYVEFEVPPENADLSEYLGYQYNTSELVGVKCESSCNKMVQKEKRMRISNVEETEFITVILTRTMDTEDGYKFNTNNIESTNDLLIRYILVYLLFVFKMFLQG